MAVRPIVIKSKDQIAELLRGRRLELGISPDELKDNIGMTNSDIPKIEALSRKYGHPVVHQPLFGWAEALVYLGDDQARLGLGPHDGEQSQDTPKVPTSEAQLLFQIDRWLGCKPRPRPTLFR